MTPKAASICASFVALASFILLVATMSRWMNLYDEAIPVVGAMRVAAGEVPHRDFYSIYGPAPYYLLAGLFKAFGTSFLTERIYDAAIKAGVIGVFFYIAVRQARLLLASLATAVVILWFIGVGLYGYVTYPVLLLGLAGTWLLVPREGMRIAPASAALAGAFTGSMALFRYDTAGFTLVAHGSAVAILILRDRGDISQLRSLITIAVNYVFGCTAVFIPVVILFYSIASIHTFLFDIFGINAQNYAEMRRLPWPDLTHLAAHLEDAAIYFPICTLALIGAVLLGERRNSTGTPTQLHAFLLLFGALTGAFLLKGIIRVSIQHMLMAVVASTLVLTVLAEQLLRLSWPGARATVATGCSCLVLLAVSALKLYGGSPLLAAPANAIASATPVSPGLLPAPLGMAAQFVAAHTSPSERIFVGRTHHDRLAFNAMAVYFAAGRLPATHWHHFDPGLQTRADIQRDIITELERAHVRWLILESYGDNIREPNSSSISSGIRLLDIYIASHYRPVASWGGGVVQAWTRKTR